MTDENRTFLLFPDDGDDLTEWDEASDLTIQNEQLEEILSEERALELERELEQDGKPKGLHRRTGGRRGRSCSCQRKTLKAPDTGRGVGTAGGCCKNRGRLSIRCQRMGQVGSESGTTGA